MDSFDVLLMPVALKFYKNCASFISIPEYLDTEWQGIERMASSGIIASPERLKEYIRAACLNGSIVQVRDKIILCISDLLRQEEELCVETDSLLRDILVMLESVRELKKLKQVFLGGV